MIAYSVTETKNVTGPYPCEMLTEIRSAPNHKIIVILQHHVLFDKTSSNMGLEL